MKTYSFKIIVEPDEDRWFACCPALEKYGAATWGYTEEEARRNIQEVVQLVIEGLKEDGEPIPEPEESEWRPSLYKKRRGACHHSAPDLPYG